ncbi:hypothetical protein FA048_03190 [Pedobacter polaris]|uniref:Uncharacterized protein n=1 Tax=Pedobacter polaris TaxID=2571273 RepID=A0A4U1CYX2_9SPHI|nr:hypothetical protein [Pedobacter polaris]TKC12638.1 hypothetical protein FA048_03190 [Pedobacter polaris]
MKSKNSCFFIFITSILFFAGCNSDSKVEARKTPKSQTEIEDLPENNLKFKDVNGIRFFEVKRRFKNGVSFNNDGFQQIPTWIIQFKAPDTMLAYSPEKKKMESFYLHHDHGRIYNFAREYFRVRIISKDSLVLQRVQVDAMKIAGDDDPRSDVYSTYYSKKIIDKLNTTIGELQKPTSRDTLFIKDLSLKTYKDPSNPTVAFPATSPVVFVPNSKNVSVEKISTADELNNRKSAVDYFYPYYKIVINKSYKDFVYNFSVVVDANGKMYVTKGYEFVLPEYREQRKKLLQGIADMYLSNLFYITPGKTLGIPHSSEISLKVIGRTGN